MMPLTLLPWTLNHLHKNGIAQVDGLKADQVADIWRHLDQKPRWRGHVKQNGRLPSESDTVTCWGMDDVVTAPHLFELGLSYTELARQYLGVEPRMYSLNAFTTYPSHAPMNPDIQLFHRDKDDSQFLALFVYLTDVGKDGAHLFQRGTHGGTSDGEVISITGRAGTAFLADTRGLHLGKRPENDRRTLAWVRWGVSDPPPSYVWDRLSPVPKSRLGDRYPTDPSVQQMVRLVVQ